MSLLAYIVIFSLLGSIGSLIGGVFLLWKEEYAKRVSRWLVSFAAGVLLGVSFLDLIPEAVEKINTFDAGLYILLAMLVFLLIEKLFVWYHCHDDNCDIHSYNRPKYLIIFGDAIHNFIDGIIIAVSFMVSIPLGISVSLAVILHEIPQEISDFAVLMHEGVSKLKNLLVNMAAALATLAGAILTYFMSGKIEHMIPFLVSFAAGTFIYIASADLIPELHKEQSVLRSVTQFAVLVLGIGAVWLTTGI